MTVTTDTPVVQAGQRIDTEPVRKATAGSLLRLARDLSKTHPELLVHQHLQDAATQVRIGNDDGALRHLRSAVYGLQPQALTRQGIHDDAGHVIARKAAEDVIRHHHLVKDLQDAEAHNQAAIERLSYGDAATAPRNPNAGYGPGALAQKPAARQPRGNQALNAPARNNSGGPDRAAADPNGRQPRSLRCSLALRTLDSFFSVK